MASQLRRFSGDVVLSKLPLADYQNMQRQLHITSLRRGRDGSNKDSPYYANYAEANANPFPDLPDPLTLKNGKKKVTTASVWWSKRRPEIMEDFDREIYGRVPANVPVVKWEVIKAVEEKVAAYDVVTMQVQGLVDNSLDPNLTVKTALTVTTPKDAKGKVPVIMQFGGFGFGPPPNFAGRGLPGAGRGPSGPTRQQQVLAKGWAYAQLAPNSIQADNGAGLTAGIIGLTNKGQRRKSDDWGVLRAWAWGARRAVDYFETNPALDARHTAIEGHSRYGKAALVAMAYDPRLWAAYISSSGEAGAKLFRRNWGETVENIADRNAYTGWRAIISGTQAHSPRPIFPWIRMSSSRCARRTPCSSAAAPPRGDAWVDAKGMFMAAAAGPVYRLLGRKDLGTTEFPPIEAALIDGDIAFRQHSSGHTDGRTGRSSSNGRPGTCS